MNNSLNILRKLTKTIVSWQFFKFAIVGFANTALYYLVYFILLQLGFYYYIALTIGTITGIINSYIWNKIFTFMSKQKSMSEKIKFLTVYGVQYLNNLLITHLCIRYLGLIPEVAGLIAIGIGVFISYFGHKFWTFRS